MSTYCTYCDGEGRTGDGTEAHDEPCRHCNATGYDLKALQADLAASYGHSCGHSVCSQHYIDTGSRECVQGQHDGN